MLPFSKDKLHTICLCASGYRHIHTLGHEMNFPAADAPISPGVTCSFARRRGRRNFCAELRYAEVSRIDPRLQSRERPGAGDIELFRSTPPVPDLRTDSSTGAMLKLRLQTQVLFSVAGQEQTERVKTRYHTFNNLIL